jgi:predicted N-formylglutamate amidohydrolase
LIEVRNDLIETAHDQDVWAALLAPLLKSALAEVQPHPPS